MINTKIVLFIIITSIVAIGFFVPPAIKLWTAMTNAGSLEGEIGIDIESAIAFSPEQFKNPEISQHYSSQHFELYIAKDYMSDDQANEYLIWLEGRYELMLDFLGYREALASNGKTIDVFLLDTPGTSFSQGTFFVVHFHLEGMDASVHELTHSLDFAYARSLLSEHGIQVNDYNDILFRNDGLIHSDYMNFYEEQRAVLTEDELGAGFSFPNYGLPINATIYAALRQGTELESFSELNTKTLLLENNAPSTLRYSIAGSFARYLVSTYGITKHNKVVTEGYSGAYNKSLRELESEWYNWLEDGYVLNIFLMMLAGIAVLMIGHVCFGLEKKAFWFCLIPLVTALLAYLAWGYYLSFGDDDLWLLAFAILVGLIVRNWSPKAGIITLWSTGLILGVLPLGLYLL